jgi:3-methyladenine DNA glycosylase AlkD
MKNHGRKTSRPLQGTRAQLVLDLAALGDPAQAAVVAKYFKSGAGEYGEGDSFLGISVPVLRKVVLQYRLLSLPDVALLLASPTHEHRLAALEILVTQYERGTEADRKKIVEFYLGHTEGINNWDLVDTSAPYILGEHLKTRSRRLLVRLAKSKSVWKRRMAIVSTLTLIRGGETADTFQIAEMLLSDRHDLIHKAVGWALREAGKVSEPELLAFLAKHYVSISRTTLRYAIERFPPQQRKRILLGQERAGKF